MLSHAILNPSADVVIEPCKILSLRMICVTSDPRPFMMLANSTNITSANNGNVLRLLGQVKHLIGSNGIFHAG